MRTLLAFILVIGMQRETYRVQPFLQDIGILYTTGHGLSGNDVRALAVSGGFVWAGTTQGLDRTIEAEGEKPALKEVRWKKIADLRVQTMIPDGKGGVYAATDSGVYRVRSDGTYQALQGLETLLVKALALADDGALWCLTPERLYRWQEGVQASYEAPEGKQMQCLVIGSGGGVYVGATGALESFLYRLNNGGWEKVGIQDDRGRYWDDRFRTGLSDSIGHLWLGTPSGLVLTDGRGWWYHLRGEDGLPYEEVTCLALAPNGDVWVGTSQGACRGREGHWSYFWGKRWLPGNEVRAIAIDAHNRAWIATDGGVGLIESRRMTLQEKAHHYEAITAARHNRYGFVTICQFRDPGDLNSYEHEASDNDGLWTALYAAAQCFRYATTRDPQARELARQSMRAILDLERLTGIPGFPARALVRKGEPRVFLSSGEWHDSPVDPNCRWKGDTSSDELDGHYFLYPIYYDLVADEKEKEELRAAIRRITDHLLENNYQLVDLDGKPTRWAIFNPENLNENPIWEEERGLNSLSILSHLKVAYHMTGDPKYQAAYEQLIKKHHYLLNAITQKMLPPYEVNHSDDQLAFLCYYPLLLYETDPEYRRIWLLSLERSWQIERPERSPLFNFIYGAVTGKPCDVEASVQTLKEWPWDLRHWAVRNSHRADIRLDPSKGRFNEPQSVQVIPYSERALMQWNGNPYRLDGDGNGEREDDGAAFLLPYWMGRYWKIIEEASP